MKQQEDGGFTLIELMVVLTLIAALAAILFPVLAHTRTRARQATCAHNLAQIARAGMMYVQDYDERFPSCYWSANPPFEIDPRTLLQPYLKNWGTFYCPERHTVREECLDPGAGFQRGGLCMGYGYNWGSAPGWGPSSVKADGLVRPGSDSVSGVALAEVVIPARCFFYGDTNDTAFLTLKREAMPGVHPKEQETVGAIGPGRLTNRRATAEGTTSPSWTGMCSGCSSRVGSGSMAARGWCRT